MEKNNNNDDNEVICDCESIYLETGIKFNPTDQVLIREYLMNKVNPGGSPLPCCKLFMEKIIKDINIYLNDPVVLTAEHKYGCNGKEWYFFMKSENGRQSRTTLGGGGWHARTRDDIMDEEGHRIGERRQFAFQGKASVKDHWIMHQFSLVGHTENNNDYVLCRMHNNSNRNNKTSGHEQHHRHMPALGLEVPQTTTNVQQILHTVNTSSSHQSINEALIMDKNRVEQQKQHQVVAPFEPTVAGNTEAEPEVLPYDDLITFGDDDPIPIDNDVHGHKAQQGDVQQILHMANTSSSHQSINEALITGMDRVEQQQHQLVVPTEIAQTEAALQEETEQVAVPVPIAISENEDTVMADDTEDKPTITIDDYLMDEAEFLFEKKEDTIMVDGDQDPITTCDEATMDDAKSLFDQEEEQFLYAAATNSYRSNNDFSDFYVPLCKQGIY